MPYKCAFCKSVISGNAADVDRVNKLVFCDLESTDYSHAFKYTEVRRRKEPNFTVVVRNVPVEELGKYLPEPDV